MSANKRYYFLKLKENFFREETILLLEDCKDGTADFLPRVALDPNTTFMISFITRGQKSLGNSVFLGLSLLLLKQGWLRAGPFQNWSAGPHPAADCRFHPVRRSWSGIYTA